MQDVIHARLAARHQLVKIPLPLSALTDHDHDHDRDSPPHTPIFVSRDLRAARRVVVIAGEPEQDLGVLAHRVLGGAGGIDEGSMVSIVQALQQQQQQQQDSVAVVLANTGETWWWPEGRRALCYRQSLAAPMRSAVMRGRWFDARVNGIVGSADAEDHVRSLFETLLGSGGGGEDGGESSLLGLRGDAVVEVIGLTEGAVAVERYLDANWDRWSGRIGCLALVGGGKGVDELKNEGFKKFLKEVSFFFLVFFPSSPPPFHPAPILIIISCQVSTNPLPQKARAYITTTAPLGTAMANPGGNPNTVYFTSYGCPVLSAGESYYTELALIKSKSLVLPWMDEVYRAGGAYVNPELDVTFRDESFADEPAWSGKPWDLPDGDGGVDGTGSSAPRPRAVQVQDEDEGGLEIITRDEWERRQEEAEDEGEEADLSKVVVI